MHKTLNFIHPIGDYIMISTVTTTTVTSVSSVALAASLSLVVVLLFLALLINKEIVSSVETSWAQRLSRIVNVALVPAGLACAFTIVVKVMEVL